MVKRPTFYKGKLSQQLSPSLRDENLESEIHYRIDLLFTHYNVDGKKEDAWCALALRLARQHVPGFQHRTKVGAPEKWTDVTRGILAIDIAKLQKEDPNLSSAEACRRLSRKKPWNGPTFKGEAKQWQQRLEDEAVKGRKTTLYNDWLKGKSYISLHRTGEKYV